MTHSQSRLNLRYCTIDGLLATPWTMIMLPGSFIMAPLLNQIYQVSPAWFGRISAMPAAANALQILLIPFLARFLTVRDLNLNAAWLNLGLWITALMSLFFLPIGDASSLFFLCFFGMISISSSLIGVAWPAWIADFVPDRIRGRYFGFRNRLTMVSTITFILIAILLLQIMGSNRTTYALLIGLAVGGRLFSVLIQHLIVSPDPTGGRLSHSNWWESLLRLKEEYALIRFVGFSGLVGFCGGFLATLTPLFAFNRLEITPTEFTGLSLTATISGMLAVRIWGKLVDQHGTKPVIILSLLLWKTFDFGWIVLTPATKYGLFLVWAVGGMMAAGFLLATFNMLLQLIPKESRTAGISLNLTVTSILTSISAVFAGELLSMGERSGWQMDLLYRWGIGIALICSMSCVLIVWTMREPKADPQRNTIPGAMRTLRQMSVNQGLAFFSNFTLQRRRGK